MGEIYFHKAKTGMKNVIRIYLARNLLYFRRLNGKFSQCNTRPKTFGLLSLVLFILIFIISLTNALLRRDSEPQLILAFFGFPFTWVFLSIFRPVLEWIGPFGSTVRRVAEWTLLGCSGGLQYWIIGRLAGYLINRKR
jgi:hypothetical protein